MILLTIDFESFYTQEYSLRQMTTVEYIRDPRFEVIMCGFQVNDGKPYWVPGPKVADELSKFDPSETAVICHNAKFDISILCWKYGFNPVFYFDTLSMVRYCFPTERATIENVGPLLGLGEKGHEIINAKGKHLADFSEWDLARFGEYCLQDVRIAHGAYKILKTRIPWAEMELIDLILRMYTEPIIELNPAILQELYDDEREKTVNLFSKVYPGLEEEARKAIYENDEAAWKKLKTPLSSNPQFAKLLMEHGIDPPKKLSPSKVKDGRIDPNNVKEKPTGLLDSKEEEWTYAFSKSDEEFKYYLDDPDDAVRELCELRVNAKSTIKTTRAKTFLNIQKTGTLPIPLKPFSAHTGRLGGDEYNPQNFPKLCTYCGGKKGGCGKCYGTEVSQIRLSLQAPEGCVIVVRDLSAIEARVLAWLARQDDVLETFRRGEDIYCYDASQLYGRIITKEDFVERQLGKIKRLACGYSIWTKTFQERVRLGILGIPGMLLGEDIAAALGVNVENYILRWEKLIRETLPPRIDFDTHAVHMACCDAIIGSFRSENPQIVGFWEDCQLSLETILAGRTEKLGRNGVIEVIPEGYKLPNGFIIQYTDLQKHEGKRRVEYTILKNRQKKERGRVYGGLITENLVQALSRIIMTDQMLEMKCCGLKVVMTVHDEILVVCREEDAKFVYSLMGEIMNKSPWWAPELPLKSSGGYARNYVK